MPTETFDPTAAVGRLRTTAEPFRRLLLIGHMDNRNQTRRTARELELVFAKLSEADLCLDERWHRDLEVANKRKAQGHILSSPPSQI